MAQQSFTLEHIIDLAEELRLVGFDVGTQQYVAAQDLIIALAANDRLPEEPREFSTLLAPIFCSSPGEQEEFYQRFKLWLKRHPEFGAAKDDSAKPAAVQTIQQTAARQLHFLRKPLGIAALCLLVVMAMGAGYLSLDSEYTLTGQVLSSEGKQPVVKAQVEFFNQTAETDGEGKFSIRYRARNYRRIYNRQAPVAIAHFEHASQNPAVNIHNPPPQTITLQKLPPRIEQNPDSVNVPVAEATPPPVPVILPQALISKSIGGGDPEFGENSRNQRPLPWTPLLLASLPLVLFAAWWLWRWRRRRALLQKLQASGDPQLNRIRVKGAADLLFQSQAFRRAAQELRRHRQVAIKDLDINSTVRATIGKGGMFTPRYGARRTSPEYLLLIDRATFGDEQARFGEEVSRRLEAGGVFVDRYYFQNDPRTCRQREPRSPMLTLHELAARHPDHQLLIFSDGAGLLSPITGEPEHWLGMLDHWPRRVLLTPELAAANDYRELALAEHYFVILPATEEGLGVLAEILNADVATKPNGSRESRPFPPLILERPKRWLERREPKPAAVNELCDQLKEYLDEDGWQWLAACAVYPTLSWDVTLYLGYKLFGRAEGFEARLLSLVRLPWFRHGTMPDWLRLRLIESFTTEQERAVRRALEDLLLSALDRPPEGVELEFAAPVPAKEATGWRQRLRALKGKLAEWRRKRKLADLIKNEPPESPLRDYVFLGFFSGTGANRLTVNLPEGLRRLLFPKGKAVLGLRTATALFAALLLAAPGAYWLYRTLRQFPPPPVTDTFYQQMSAEEKTLFVRKQVDQVTRLKIDSFPDGTFASVLNYVNGYAERVGNGSKELFTEDLSYVFARGIQYAPIISQAFRDHQNNLTIGLYLAMIRSEYRPCLDSQNGKGLFQLSASAARDMGIQPNDLCDVGKSANGVALFMKNASSVEFSPKQLTEIQLKQIADPITKLLTPEEKLVAAAIVGENPKTFGLDMKPLSAYGNAAEPVPTPSASPRPTTTMRPRATATPGAQTSATTPSGCDNNLTEKDGHVIHAIMLQTGDGAMEDIGDEYPLGPVFKGKIYKAGDADRIKAEAGGLFSARKINPSSVWVCVRVISCRALKGCVDVYLRASSARANGNAAQRPPTASDPPASNPPAPENQGPANVTNSILMNKQSPGPQCSTLETLVDFKLRGSTEPAKSYPFIREDDRNIWFCVGDDIRSMLKSQITILGYSQRRVAALPREPTSSSSVCRPALTTDPVHAAHTVTPVEFPLLAQPRNSSEKIELSITYLANGKIGPVSVVQSPSKEFSELAVEAARKIRFNPAWEVDHTICVIQSYSYGYESVRPLMAKLVRNNPMTFRFSWEPLLNAKSYILEVEYTSSNGLATQSATITGTSHEMIFGSLEGGRWRVSALLSTGSTRLVSAWQPFKPPLTNKSKN